MIGFSKNELKVFNKVTRNPQSVADIVHKAKMPRMTVYKILLRLKKIGILKSEKTEGRKRLMWSRNQDSAIEKELSSTRDFLFGVKQNKKKSVPFLGVNFYHGKKEVANALMELTKRRDGARMYSIQNSKNWKRWIDIMGKKWVNEHNSAVVRHKLVCFTLHSPEAPEDIKRDKEVIEAYRGRLGNSHAIPENYLKKDLSFYIFEEIIFLVNLEKVEAVEFTNADMASFLIKMFSFMFEKGEEEEFFLKFNRR